MSEGSAGKVNMAFIAAIVAVATIGGFMFGYDSGVINGTQKGLEAAFDLGKLGIGVNVGAILVGSSIGAFGAGRMADIIGRRGVMMLAAGLGTDVEIECDGDREAEAMQALLALVNDKFGEGE